MRGLEPEYEDMGRRARPRGGQKRASANRSTINAQPRAALVWRGQRRAPAWLGMRATEPRQTEQQMAKKS